MPTLRVLYAEDNADSREVTTLILTKGGFEVIAAESGREAVALADKFSFDLVLLDFWLPDMSGVEVCRKLREMNSDLPIVFYSGVVVEAEKRKALECGAQAFITKPDGITQLAEILQRLIAGPPTS